MNFDKNNNHRGHHMNFNKNNNHRGDHMNFENFEKKKIEIKKSQKNSRSFSPNNRDGFFIKEGHVFSFQNDFSKKKKISKKKNFEENCIMEESEENSIKRNYEFDIENLDLISKKKLEKILNKKKILKKMKILILKEKNISRKILKKQRGDQRNFQRGEYMKKMKIRLKKKKVLNMKKIVLRRMKIWRR